ncbi:unnamed protein product, partial [Choristocarpus tenellus]
MGDFVCVCVFLYLAGGGCVIGRRFWLLLCRDACCEGSQQGSYWKCVFYCTEGVKNKIIKKRKKCLSWRVERDLCASTTSCRLVHVSYHCQLYRMYVRLIPLGL